MYNSKDKEGFITMINKIFAQNFVRKMEQTMNLKVNVMDERGIIVASASKERVGDFHPDCRKRRSHRWFRCCW